MKKRNLFKSAAALLLAVGLSACSGGSKDQAPSAGGDADPGSAGDSKQVYEAVFGHPFMPDTPQARIADEFKRRIEEETDGRIKITIFPAGQLGSHKDMYEGMQMGTQQFSVLPSARISGFSSAMQVFDLPFLFPSREKAYEVFDGPVGAELLATLEPSGVKGLAICEDGFKHFTASKKIETLEDFKGLKMRTMESPIIMEQFKALGSNPVPIDYSELYNALQQKTVDGEENPLATIATIKLYEVQDYMLYSEHAYLAQILLVSKDWYDSLPADLQESVSKVAKEVAVWEREEIQKLEAGYLQTIKDSGTIVLELSPEERAKMKDAMQSVYEVGKSIIGEEIVNKVVDACK